MKHRWAVVSAATCCFVAVAFSLRGSPQQGAGSASPSPTASAVAAPSPVVSGADERKAVMTKYCFTCHNEKLKSGNLALSALDLANLSKDADKWEKVVRKVRTGPMPPGKMPRPDKAVAESLVSGIEAELDRAALEHPVPGRPTLQRLNRSEYRNAIRDLLALDIKPGSKLPADDSAYGYHNNGAVLSLSPIIRKRCKAVPRTVSRITDDRAKLTPANQRIKPPKHGRRRAAQKEQ